MELENGDTVLCEVEKILGTNVFVNIMGQNKPGTIILSEVSAGRIRNLREFVVPKKIIVCKVLRISPDHIDLSLRRVTQKEQKEMMEKFKLEKSYLSILKSILKEKTNPAVEEIKKTAQLLEFIENSKENSKELEKIVGKENADKILEILKSQKKKKYEIRKELNIITEKPNGLELIKNLFLKEKDIEIHYIRAGKYSLKIEDETLKAADTRLTKILENLKKEAEKTGFQIS